MKKPPDYRDWSASEHGHWIDAGNTFGWHVLQASRDYAIGRVPAPASQGERDVATKAIHDAIYGMMMLLDGVAATPVDKDARAEYVISARIVRAGEVAEEIELAPDGDGLCMGFHGWVGGEGDT
jgi:hypothetical protein